MPPVVLQNQSDSKEHAASGVKEAINTGSVSASPNPDNNNNNKDPVNKILEGATKGDKTKGSSRMHEKEGNMSDAIKILIH